MRAVLRKTLRQVLSSSAVSPAAVVRPAGLPRSRATSRCAVGLQGASSGVPCSFPSRAARGFAVSSLLDFRAGLAARPAFFGRVA
jgi:hypothetical protein